MVIAKLEYQLDSSILTQRTVRFRIGGHDVSLFCDREVERLRNKVDVPGFRRGRCPLPLLRKYHWPRVRASAFEELKRAAYDQVFRLLEQEDQPFLPPELLDPKAIELKYDEILEFGIKYMTDPTRISANPHAPQVHEAKFVPDHLAQPSTLQGIPGAPQLPVVNLPAMPALAASEIADSQ